MYDMVCGRVLVIPYFKHASRYFTSDVSYFGISIF